MCFVKFSAVSCLFIKRERKLRSSTKRVSLMIDINSWKSDSLSTCFFAFLST